MSSHKVYINKTLNTESRYSFVTRCRRFGKSMAAKMLCAYYDKSCDSRELFRGLKDDIIRMLSGERVYVDTTEFTNDMHIVRSRNDVLTVLIHLGYLAYDDDEYECFIPNKEVRDLLAIVYEDAL